MSLSDAILDALAARLDNAARERQTLVKLTDEFEHLTLEDAYQIQRRVVARRHGRGEAHVGMKMGLTSLAKMKQMGVHDPIYGHLTDAMLVEDGASIPRSNYGQPRVEPEIAFILDKPLVGPTTAALAMQSVGGICAALEIIDSRYENFRFTLPDVVADNASAAGFVLGATVLKPSEIDVANLGMIMRKNGDAAEIGSSAAIFEHPARSLARQANMLARHGEALDAGDIVLAGGATKAIFIDAGDRIALEVDGLGVTRFELTAD